MSRSEASRRPIIAGVDFRNWNLGVSALGLSAEALLHPRLGACDAFDWRRGRRAADGEIARHAGIAPGADSSTGHRPGPFDIVGWSMTRKFWRSDSALLSEMARWTGLPLGVGARAIAASSAVLDASGGDSFADIYGARRFARVTMPKQLALALRRPLVLLPQTYGPYRDPKLRAIAGDIVARATCAVARDARSYEVLREIAGSRFDPSKHLLGTDMAFRLPTIDPAPQVLEVVDRARTIAQGAAVAGFNISGLIANEPDTWRTYGFRDDYFATCVQLVSRLLSAGAGCVVILPHVIVPGGAATESDIHASERLRSTLPKSERERVLIAQGYAFPTEAKALIRRFDWFSGSRLHATIGALSNGVSTATIAYSDKARGIFEALGVGDAVADPRVLSGTEVVEHQVRCFTERDRHRTAIAERLPGVLAVADRQMDDICRLLSSGARHQPRTNRAPT